MKLQRAGQIFGGGITAGLRGALVGAIAGCLSFGVINVVMLWCMTSSVGIKPFRPYSIRAVFYLGAGFGMTAAATIWFLVGLVSTARRHPFPTRRLAKTVVVGALIGTSITAWNSGLYLVYLAKSKAPGSGGSTIQFLRTGPLPGKIGPFISVEFPLFTMIVGLLLGIGFGSWWGLRAPAPQAEVA